jgi:putative ABC transport system permease protein
MFAYHLRLAWLSIRRSPVLATLMVVAVGVGVGVCTTMLTVYHLMSNDPIPSKSSELFRVQLDSWSEEVPFNYGDSGETGPPFWMTYMDSVALLESDIPTRHAAMYRTAAIVEPADSEVAPTPYEIRATSRDFFGMFEVPFLYGAPWDAAADQGERVAVIGRELNEKLFGDEDSVGRELRMSGEAYRIVGVIDTWNPLPRFYDTNVGPFGDPDEIFIPFLTATNAEMNINGNTVCWRAEEVNNWQAFLASDCVWIMFWAELPDPAQRRAYLDHLDAYVMSQKELGRFPRPLDNRIRDVMEWLDVRQVVSDDSRVLVALSFLFLAVCLLNTVGLLLARFIGAAPRVSLQRALGASRWTIVRQHLVEVSVIGFAGGLLGLGVASLGLWLIRSGWSEFERITQMDWTMAGGGIGLAVVASLLAGIYPAWRLTNVSPAIYLKTQ